MERKVLLVAVLVLLIGISVGITLTTLLLGQSNGEEVFQQLTDYEHTVKTKFVAVDQKGGGVVADLITEVRGGHGLVLVNINNLLADISTQYSARVAASVASNFTKIDVSTLDIIYNLQSDAGVVAGQSAGSIMAVSAIAALQNQTLRDDVIITGSINPTGELVDAGGLRAKAAAAKKGNARLLLVPEGSGSQMINLTRTEDCGFYQGKEYCIIDYPGELVSIGEEFGIEVVEVETVAEAMRYFL
ncbi:hypothetical protein HYS50_02670 [Candidatus Woesearchaeota archaeon]|nr:hypothetical protein [Candidatus Woesearchaeota archaeon]